MIDLIPLLAISVAKTNKVGSTFIWLYTVC